MKSQQEKRVWKHLKTIDEHFEEEYWCQPEEQCSLCDERRKKRAKEDN